MTLLTRLTILFAFASPLLRADELSGISIAWEKRQLESSFFAEGACFGDLDRDGHTDVVAGPFAWLGPDFERRIEIYPPKPFEVKGYSDNFMSYTHDLDGDDWLDVVVIGFPGKETRWYQNPGNLEAGHWPVHIGFDATENESALFTDLTGDGKPELVCSRGGMFGYATPDWANPTTPWTWHPISPEKATGGRFTHGLGVGDVDGDGRLDLLEKNRWWRQPDSLDGDPLWTSHRSDFTPKGGAQMFAYDFDGDGDNDVLTSLAAHAYGLAWFEQIEEDDRKRLVRRDIMTDKPEENAHGLAFSQLHAIDLADIDGDGVKDIVTGKRFWAHNGRDPGGNDPAVLYWFRTVRENGGVSFVPYKIDHDSGVGTEVKAGDVNGDGLLDIVSASKKGVFVHLQRRPGA